MPPSPLMTHPARAKLEQYNHQHPGIWQDVDEARAARNWPPQIFLTTDAAQRINGKREKDRALPTRLNELQQLVVLDMVATGAALLAMFSAWRVTQGIYRFDPDVYASLIETPITGELPVELLLCLPEWCVYLETPGLRVCGPGNPEQVGVWAWLDWEKRDSNFWLFFAPLQANGSIGVNSFPLCGTLDASIHRLMKAGGLDRARGSKTLQSDYVRWLTPMVSLLLYLVSEACDFGDEERRPGKPSPVRTKGSERMFPAPKPSQWEAGVRMGAALRAARAHEAAQTQSEDRERRTVRPHVRRAHWAHRWIGPRSGERKSVLRWIHPALVNAKSADDLPAVIREP